MWSAIWLQYGVLLIPLGVIVLFSAFQLLKGWAFYAEAFASACLIGLGLWALSKAIKAGKLEEAKKDEQFKSLISEIKNVSQILSNIDRGVKDDRGNDKNNL